MSNKKWIDLIDFENFYKNVETESLSSVEDLEDNDNLKDYIELNINNEEISKEIEDIVNDRFFEKYNSLELIEKQDIISSFLCKSIQNNILDSKILYKYILYLKDSSFYLLKMVKLNEFKHNYTFIKKDKIIRSSYKFCNYKHNCSYNYDRHKKKGCYADHYPHDMIYADCDALIYCLDKYYKNESEFYNKEIIKCINTISYVIKHMYEELNNLCLYSNSKDYNKFHYVKSTSKKIFNSKNNLTI